MMEVDFVLFDDRRDAGRRLAERLADHADTDTIVLGLARGGVPVAYEIARALHIPLDVLVVRKIGAPYQPELAIGALAPGAMFLNREILGLVGVSDAELDALVDEKTRELLALLERLRGDQPKRDVRGKTAIIVDDGVATGATMFASVDAVRAQGAAQVIVAVPVGAVETLDELRERADEVFCLHAPEPFMAVGAWYRSFDQTSDQEVRSLLEKARSQAELSDEESESAVGRNSS